MHCWHFASVVRRKTDVAGLISSTVAVVRLCLDAFAIARVVAGVATAGVRIGSHHFCRLGSNS